VQKQKVQVLLAKLMHKKAPLASGEETGGAQ